MLNCLSMYKSLTGIIRRHFWVEGGFYLTISDTEPCLIYKAFQAKCFGLAWATSSLNRWQGAPQPLGCLAESLRVPDGLIIINK